jgi:hypothetical protein
MLGYPWIVFACLGCWRYRLDYLCILTPAIVCCLHIVQYIGVRSTHIVLLTYPLPFHKNWQSFLTQIVFCFDPFAQSWKLVNIQICSELPAVSVDQLAVKSATSPLQEVAEYLLSSIRPLLLILASSTTFPCLLINFVWKTPWGKIAFVNHMEVFL